MFLLCSNKKKKEGRGKKEEDSPRIHFTSPETAMAMTMTMEYLLLLKLRVILFLLFLLFLLLAFFHMRALADDHLLPEKDEIQSVISVLRGSGYHIFANALEMVDIQPLLSSGDSYTFFAPPDAALEALDLASKSSREYMDAVKYHIVNVKLSYSNLNSLPDGAHLDTLLRNRSLTVTTFTPDEDEDEDEDDALMVNNAAVSFPDLYYDNRFAVHGLTAFLNPTAVDVLSVCAFWKAPDAMATASWEPEPLGDLFAQSNRLPLCSYPIQNASVTPPENDIEKIWETSRHQEDSTAQVLPATAPAPSPCDEVASNASLKLNEEIRSKKMDEVICTCTCTCSTTSTSHLSVSVGERCSSAEYSADQKCNTGDHPHHHRSATQETRNTTQETIPTTTT